MNERDYTSYYRPLPLIQRDGVSTLGRPYASRGEYARRETSYARERTRAYASDFEDDDAYSTSDRSSYQRPSSFRVVQGTRDSSRASSRSERRTRSEQPASRRRSTRGTDTSATGSRFGLRKREDDFDDYYAEYDEDVEEFDPYEDDSDDFEEYDVYEDDEYGTYDELDDEYEDEYDDGYYEESDADSYDYESDERMSRRFGSSRSYGARDYSRRSRDDDRFGSRSHVDSRPGVYDYNRPRARSFSLLSLIALPFAFLRDLMLYHVRISAFILAVALTIFMLFTPARNLYVAHRQLEELQATYAELEAENKAILEEIQFLQTDEGVEDEARERGYVAEGETKVVVEGLNLTDDSDPTSELTSAEVVDDRPWYIRFLDWVFGYKGGE